MGIKAEEGSKKEFFRVLPGLVAVLLLLSLIRVNPCYPWFLIFLSESGRDLWCPPRLRGRRIALRGFNHG